MNTHIVIVIMTVAITVVLGQERDPRSQEFKQMADQCKTKVGASDDDMKTVMHRNAPTTKAGQCLLACIKKKSGWMDDDNKVNVEMAKKFMEPMKEMNKEMYDKMIKMLEECKALETTEADECVAAKKFAECMVAKRNAAGLPSH